MFSVYSLCLSQIYDQITLIDEHKLTISISRSCPELDKDIGAGFPDKNQIEFLDFPNIMEKNISRSAHSIKVCLNIHRSNHDSF